MTYICSLKSFSDMSYWERIADKVPVAYEKEITPVSMMKIATTRSTVVVAEISPYPTVVIVEET